MGAHSIFLQMVTDDNSLVALALGAKHNRLCKPQVTAKNIIDIKGGRYVFEVTWRCFIVADRRPKDTFCRSLRYLRLFLMTLSS